MPRLGQGNRDPVVAPSGEVVCTCGHSMEAMVGQRVGHSAVQWLWWACPSCARVAWVTPLPPGAGWQIARTARQPETPPVPAAEQLARRFHDTYERLAPEHGYCTREETREFDPTTPNGRLMVAVCAEMLGQE